MGHDQPFDVQTREELEAAIDAATQDVDQPEKIARPNSQVIADMGGGVVRPGHAADVLRKPDSYTVLGFGDVPDFYMAAKLVPGDQPFVLLATGVRLDSREVEPLSAFRLYGTEEELAEMSASAPAAFCTLLERFGNRFESKGREVLFVPTITVPFVGTAQSTIERAFRLDLSLDSEWATPMSARPLGEWLELRWPFVIDLARYKAAAREGGWRG